MDQHGSTEDEYPNSESDSDENYEHEYGSMQDEVKHNIRALPTTT